jgi:hypothetical protein
LRFEWGIAVVISLRNNLAIAEGEKHRDECFHLAPRGQIHHGNREDSGPLQLDGHLIACFDNPLHRVGLRPKELLPFLIGGAQVAGAADATLRGNPVWKFWKTTSGL